MEQNTFSEYPKRDCKLCSSRKKGIYKFEGHWDVYIFGCIAGVIATIIAFYISGVLCL